MTESEAPALSTTGNEPDTTFQSRSHHMMTLPAAQSTLPSARFAYHPYHLTALSPWPVMTAMSVFGMLASLALWFNLVQGAGVGLSLGVIGVLATLTAWFTDVSREASLLGLHTKVVQQAHVMGVGLFITTEAMFFMSVFWAFFHSALSPTVELGSEWPPMGLEAVSPIMVPLLNTALLMSSGATVTYAHHAMFTGSRGPAITGLLWTLSLAMVFTALQAYEYQVSSFTLADGAFGSTFYFSTGCFSGNEGTSLP